MFKIQITHKKLVSIGYLCEAYRLGSTRLKLYSRNGSLCEEISIDELVSLHIDGNEVDLGALKNEE